MGLIYKPFGIILGILGGLVGKKLFDFAWTKIDDEEPLKAHDRVAPWVKMVGAAAVQGVIFKVTRVVVDRYGAIGFRYLTGRGRANAPGPRRLAAAASEGRTRARRGRGSASSNPAKSRARSGSSGGPPGPTRTQRRSPGRRRAPRPPRAGRAGSAARTLWSSSPVRTRQRILVEHGQQLLVGEAEQLLEMLAAT